MSAATKVILDGAVAGAVAGAQSQRGSVNSHAWAEALLVLETWRAAYLDACPGLADFCGIDSEEPSDDALPFQCIYLASAAPFYPSLSATESDALEALDAALLVDLPATLAG